MNKKELKRIEKLANAANYCEWSTFEDYSTWYGDDAEAKFSAELSPSKVLELLQHIKEQESRIKELEGMLERSYSL